MSRKHQKPNVTTKTVKGRTYHYYRMTTTANGRRKEVLIPIKAEIGSAEFDRLYWEIKSGKRKAGPSPYCLGALIESYLVSKKYAALAPSTKNAYRKRLDDIRTKNGLVDVRDITRDQIEAIHEAHAATPRQADYILQIYSILMNHAKRKSWLASNPAALIEKFGSRTEFEAWPEWFQKQYVARAQGDALALYYLGAGTGQRPGDVMKMKWSDFDGEYMTVRQEKRREKDAHKDTETMVIFCPKRLRDFLSTWPRKGEYIFARDLRNGLKYHGLNKKFVTVRDQIATDQPEAKKLTLHGLRYVAAIELAEAGCSDSEIQAVTGHKSLQMVQKYRAKASQKRLSKAAQEKRK